MAMEQKGRASLCVCREKQLWKINAEGHEDRADDLVAGIGLPRHYKQRPGQVVLSAGLRTAGTVHCSTPCC